MKLMNYTASPVPREQATQQLSYTCSQFHTAVVGRQKFESWYQAEEKAEEWTSCQNLDNDGREGTKTTEMIKLKAFLLATVLIASKLKG